MAEGKKYIVKVQGIFVEVTQEVYLAYYRIERHAKTLDEKDERNGLVFYHAMDTDEISGEETIPDQDTISVEDMAVNRLLREKLRQCIAMLPEPERELIHALYFDEMTERQYAKKLGISRRGLNKRRHKAVGKLKNMMNL